MSETLATGYRRHREVLLSDSTLTGAELGRALTQAAEQWLVALFDDVVTDPAGVALVAAGSLGRCMLAPASDIDLLLLHAGRDDSSELAERLWYPIWDEGVQLGHSVRTVTEAVGLAGRDLHTATSLLDMRCLAGDAELAAELAERSERQWVSRSRHRLAGLEADVRARQGQFGEVAFLLEPDLKDGRGGLRDIQALRWADRAEPLIDPDDRAVLDDAELVLAGVRIELQRRTGRANSELYLDEQDSVGEALGIGDGDALMAEVSSAARHVTVAGDDLWSRVREDARRFPLLRPTAKAVSPGVVLDGSRIRIEADPHNDPLMVLRAAVAAASNDALIERPSLRRLGERQPHYPDPWPSEARALFVELLSKGQRAIPVIEALDVFDVWSRVLPEWEPNRSRPQRNAYHTYTVDRHLLEAAAQACRLTHRVRRPDLLVVGALLHDIGKGYPGDHTVVGMDLVDSIARRMGYDAADVATLVGLVEHHLLLPDVATRRDLDDEATVRTVADQLPSAEFAELLAALTEADSLATGPSAWGSWKAELVSTLTDRVVHLLSGGSFDTVQRRTFPTAEQFDLMASDGDVVAGEGDVLTVVTDDRPGQFSRTAGVLAMRGLAVLQADAYSSAAGRALSVFKVTRDDGQEPDWPLCEEQVRLALRGRLALDARVDARARNSRPLRPRAAEPAVTDVVFDTETTPDATIVEVRAAERAGVLYRTTKVLADLGCDLRLVKAQTLNHEVVDAFYVTDGDGKPLDADHRTEVELGIRHALAGLEHVWNA